MSPIPVRPRARLSHGPDQAAPPENDPSDFRPVRAAGGRNMTVSETVSKSVSERGKKGVNSFF
jgi:hypothetical protein